MKILEHSRNTSLKGNYLFNLDTERPTELKNLYTDSPEVANRLKSRLVRHFADFADADNAAVRVEDDEELFQALKALGYIE